MNTSQKAIEVAGGNLAVSKALGVTMPTVWRWGDKDRIRGRYLIKICELAGGQFTPKQLRPDIFGVAE